MPKSCYERSLFIIKQQDFQQTEENCVSARFKTSPKLFALGSHAFYRAPTPPLSFVEYLHRIPVGCSVQLSSLLYCYSTVLYCTVTVERSETLILREIQCNHSTFYIHRSFNINVLNNASATMYQLNVLKTTARVLRTLQLRVLKNNAV